MLRLLCLFAICGSACSAIPPEHDPLTIMDRSDPGLPVLSLQWRRTLADRLGEPRPQEWASAAVYGQQLLVGSSDGMFYALSTRDGSVYWRASLGATSTRPVVDDLRGLVYVGTDDGILVCLRAIDGSEVWRYATRGPILQPPVLLPVERTVIFSNEADQVYALDSITGKFHWQYKAESPEEYTLRGHAGVTVSDGMVFTGFANGTMVALRQSTGSVAWLSALKGEADRFVDVDGTPEIDGDTIYVTSSSGGVFALDKATGVMRWRIPMEGAGGVTLGDPRLYVVAAEQGVLAVDREGSVVWRQGTRGGGSPARPMVVGEYLIYSLSEDGMFIVDKRTGRLLQYFDPGDGVSAPPTVWGDSLYILSNRGVLYAMELRSF